MRLTVYLLKESFGEQTLTLGSAISKAWAKLKGFEEIELSGLDFAAKAYCKPVRLKPPQWDWFVEEHVSKDCFGGCFKDVQSCCVSMLILLEIEHRIVALNFGQGYRLIPRGEWERDFGLRVVMNSVHPTRITGIEVLRLTAPGVRESIWLRSDCGWLALSAKVNPVTDTVKTLTGFTDSGVYVEGADSLKFDVNGKTLAGMAGMCGPYLKAFKAGPRHPAFSFVNNVRLIRDPALVNLLDSSLQTSLLDPGNDIMIDFVLPYGTKRITIRYPHCTPVELTLDFTSQQVGEALHGFQQELETDTLDLHRAKVRLFDGDNQIIDSTGLYDKVDFVDDREDKSYVISDGEWYEVSREYLDMIDRAIADSTAPHERLGLPAALPGEDEGKYKDRAVLDNRDHLALPAGGGDIEGVDILSRSRQVICVEEYCGSESLLPFFSQGSAAATRIAESIEARNHVKSSLPGDWTQGRAAIENFRPGDPALIFAFAILMPPCRQSNRPDTLEARLSFFDKINYYLRRREMERLGFKVQIARVPVER